jgi:AraC-like DNA-binding protein/predicted transcriptional regulator YdeE
MEWMDNLNSVMDYVESRLDGELDTDEISRLAACPFAMFQRVFAIITGIPFAEYVRNRRLTRAAHELMYTKNRVIDIALRYCYESPDAFSAAFRRVMGVSPSKARREKPSLAYYPPLRFKLSIKGVTDMAEVIKTYKQRIPATRFIGKKYGDEDRVNGLFSAKWDEWHQNGWFADIEKAPGFNTVFIEDADAYIGLMRSKNGEPFQYWIGMFTPPGTTVPEGFSYIDLPAKSLGVCWIYGPVPDIYGRDDLVMEAFQKNGIAPVTDADGAFWFFERYACPRFTEPDAKGYVILDHCYYVAD